MAIEVTEIISIAEEVNKMNYGQVRLRIKAIEREHLSGELLFSEIMELQFLAMKIITFKNQTQS